MTSPSQRPGYFDALYAANPDPWGFTTREYERAKYKATVSALPHTHFTSGLEVGCSIGVLTEQISTRCEALLGIDIAPAALAQAQSRCSHLSQVRFAMSELPVQAPKGPFDLVVLSEVLYYFDATQISTIARLLIREMTADAVIVLVHWLGPTPDYPLNGDAAVAAFETAIGGFSEILRQRTAQYRLEVLGVP